MKRSLIIALFFPLLTKGQSIIANDGDLQGILLMLHASNRSLFDPDLSIQDSSSPKTKITLISGNRYNMKEFSHITGAVSWGNDHGMMGFIGSSVGMAGLNRISMNLHYTQQLSSDLHAGMAMGIMRMKFDREAGDAKGLIALRVIQTIQVKTSFGVGISAIRDLKSKTSQTLKSWGSWCSRLVNPNIRLGVSIEKEDGLDPQFRIMSETKVGKNWTIAGGWALGNGSISMALLRQSKKTMQGLHISNHPLLGYGIEFILQYARR